MAIDIGNGSDINTSFYYGFRQLTEIAVKALSPGINDPGTAVVALHSLSDLLAYRIAHLPETYFTDKDDVIRVVTKEKTLEDMVGDYIMPIWDYGKNDRLIQKEMLHLLTLLQLPGEQQEIGKLLRKVQVYLHTDPET